MSNWGGNPYVVMWARGEWTTVTGNYRQGQGRAARRSLLWTVHVPVALTPDTFPAVLRAVAEALETPPSQRSLPPPGGLGSP